MTEAKKEETSKEFFTFNFTYKITPEKTHNITRKVINGNFRKVKGPNVYNKDLFMPRYVAIIVLVSSRSFINQILNKIKDNKDMSI